MLALLVAACAHRNPAPAAPQETRAPGSAVADASFALTVVQVLARQAWPDWQPGEVPFVVVYPEEQWIFRAPAAPRGYSSQPFESALGPAFRAPSWTRYDGERMDFSPPHFFAQADQADGELTFTIASPALAPFSALDWATVFAHEYFHTFQIVDRRWAGDRDWLAPAYRQRLARLYLDDPDFRASVGEELRLQRRLLGGEEELDCAGLDGLARIRQERLARLEAIDPALARAERALERFEGIARYFEEAAYESKELLQLVEARDPGWRPEEAGKALDRRLGVSKGEYYYATGFALARLLDRCASGWKQELAGQDLLELARGR